ncbi:hypothetical protein HanRHA438_Chr12g0563261 [Helianthus annuus]|nr:hypothetical protein HanIR_Chr12g0595711 [Helianthus annuus]KAJ0867444.1 hypothetical protein HanRHA438_Chr12g0563261 [Helianthus annuus]
MSDNKSNSTIHIPFSWEKIPGVPKFMAPPAVANTQFSSSGNHPEVQTKMVLPLPPGSFKQPVRSVSKSTFLWEEDPFVAAMIVCTNERDKHNKGKGEVKKSFGTRVLKSKSFLFSCKHSFDVQEGNSSMMPFSLGSIVSKERVQEAYIKSSSMHACRSSSFRVSLR